MGAATHMTCVSAYVACLQCVYVCHMLQNLLSVVQLQHKYSRCITIFNLQWGLKTFSPLLFPLTLFLTSSSPIVTCLCLDYLKVSG